MRGVLMREVRACFDEDLAHLKMTLPSRVEQRRLLGDLIYMIWVGYVKILIPFFSSNLWMIFNRFYLAA